MRVCVNEGETEKVEGEKYRREQRKSCCYPVFLNRSFRVMSQASETEQIKQLQREEDDEIAHGCFRVAHHCNVIVITAFQHSLDLAPGLSVSVERVSSGQDTPGTFHLSELRSQQNRTKSEPVCATTAKCRH